MNLVGFCMNGGTLLCALSTFPLIRAVWVDRNVLRGYSFFGAVGTFLAMLLFTMGFIPLKLWWSVLFNIPGLVFWSLASIYSFKGRKNADTTKII